MERGRGEGASCARVYAYYGRVRTHTETETGSQLYVRSMYAVRAIEDGRLMEEANTAGLRKKRAQGCSIKVYTYNLQYLPAAATSMS